MNSPAQRIIEILVGTDGQSRIETRGFTGAECRLASACLESALGHRLNEQTTTEFHQTTSQTSDVASRQGERR
ncbi:DUF2997 domain-containing protein [bacterium]|nr:DUF2997 domain-containing protein [bacterium]